MRRLPRILCLGLAALLSGCAEPESLHLEGFRTSLRKLDESYSAAARQSGGATLLGSPVEGMEDTGQPGRSHLRYLTFQSEMYRGMDKGDKPGWYRKAAREEVEGMQHAPQDLRQFVLERTEEATRQREERQY